MKIQANAKINLTLDIVGRRPDGYHDLVMIMQSVGLHDNVEVNLNDSGRITVNSSSAELKDDESNIAYKAAKVFLEYSGINERGVDIAIEKNIPMEAGMAGGSADGAAVIVALNELCSTGYSQQKLWNIGVNVGADVPFCITGGTMLAEGKGEILSVLPNLSDFPEPPVILLCKPEIGVSTGRAYSAVDSCELSPQVRPNTEAVKRALAGQNIQGVAQNLKNVFDEILQIDECRKIKSTMLTFGALGACMTGSGTTVFGIFDSTENAEECAEFLKKHYVKTYITGVESKGCLISD